MSNRDKTPQASQSDAQATFQAEMLAAAIQGNADLHRYWANWAGQNTGNKLYKNA